MRKRENECGKMKEWIEEAERVFLSSHVGEGDGDDLCIGETESKVSWIGVFLSINYNDNDE
jgi:hypothetical protein